MATWTVIFRDLDRQNIDVTALYWDFFGESQQFIQFGTTGNGVAAIVSARDVLAIVSTDGE